MAKYIPAIPLVRRISWDHEKRRVDVIIGNPPYIINTPDNVPYRIKENVFKTFSCKNLYAFVLRAHSPARAEDGLAASGIFS